MRDLVPVCCMPELQLRLHALQHNDPGSEILLCVSHHTARVHVSAGTLGGCQESSSLWCIQLSVEGGQWVDALRGSCTGMRRSEPWLLLQIPWLLRWRCTQR